MPFICGFYQNRLLQTILINKLNQLFNDIGKYRAFNKFKVPVIVKGFRTCNVGRHEIRGKLDPVKVQVKYFGQRIYRQRFR